MRNTLILVFILIGLRCSNDSLVVNVVTVPELFHNIKKNNNSITKSLLLLRRKKFIEKKTNYQIVVKKNIPVFSGLGGGSSNAASILSLIHI